MAEQSNPVAINKYFGKLPGQTTTEFLSEYKKLTESDRQELADGIRNGSLTY